MTLATPDWAEIVQAAIASALFDTHTAMPGQIVAVHTDASGRGQLADVRPCLRNALAMADDAEGFAPFVEEDLPIIPRVPIAFPQGGGFAITWPLAAGDFVLLVFAERSIDQWLATAAKSRQVAISTGDLGTHTLDGAVALPLGPAPLGHLLSPVSSTAMRLGSDTGKAIYVTATKVNLGSSAPTDAVALASKTNGNFTANQTDLTVLVTALKTAIAGLDPSGVISGAFNTAVAAIPATPTGVGSTVVASD